MRSNMGGARPEWPDCHVIRSSLLAAAHLLLLELSDLLLQALVWVDSLEAEPALGLPLPVPLFLRALRRALLRKMQCDLPSRSFWILHATHSPSLMASPSPSVRHLRAQSSASAPSASRPFLILRASVRRRRWLPRQPLPDMFSFLSQHLRMSCVCFLKPHASFFFPVSLHSWP